MYALTPTQWQAAPTWRNWARCPCRLLLALLIGLGFGVGAHAQDASSEESALRQARAWLDQAVQQQVAGNPANLRIQMELGQLDARLKLAPCQTIESYLPAGQSLWGRTRVGLRCTQGAVRWNVFLPVTVHAWGQAWVLTRNVPSGGTLSDGDAVLSEVDWAEDASPIVARRESWSGQVASRPLQAGASLRQAMIRAPEVFPAGAQIRVVALGSGFRVTADGQALNAGVIGQLARVRMEGGRIMSGMVVDKNTVQVQI